MAGRFIENIRRAREATQESESEQATPKPTEQMTDIELEEAITVARRELLDAQHQELRERELSRMAPAEQTQASGTTLAEILRDKQANKRKTWR